MADAFGVVLPERLLTCLWHSPVCIDPERRHSGTETVPVSMPNEWGLCMECLVRFVAGRSDLSMELMGKHTLLGAPGMVRGDRKETLPKFALKKNDINEDASNLRSKSLENKHRKNEVKFQSHHNPPSFLPNLIQKSPPVPKAYHQREKDKRKVNIFFRIYLVNCPGSLFFIAVMYCNST